MRKILFLIVVVVILVGAAIAVSILAFGGAETNNYYNRPRFDPPPYKQEMRLLRVSQNGKVGYIDTSGKIVIEPTLLDSRGFAEGLAATSAMVGGIEKWGYIDQNGTFVIKPQYAQAHQFSEGRAAVRSPESKQWGFINARGEWVIEPSLDYVGLFRDGVVRVGAQTTFDRLFSLDTSITCEYFYLDRWGEKVEPPIQGPRSSNALELFHDQETYLYGYKDVNGNVVIGPTFESASENFSEGLAAAKVTNRWGYITQNGEFAIPPQFEEAGVFSDGLAAIKHNNLWGYIRSDGTMVIDIRFNSASIFQDGVASVVLNGSRGYIRTDGTWIWKPSQ